MGLYLEHVVPRIVNRQCGQARFDDWRARAAEGLHGRVVEVGFGSGCNVGHYPAAVEAVLAVEPSNLAWRLAGKRLRAAPTPVSRLGLDGAHIPLGDASCDAALCTFTLCTVSDPAETLSELYRVVRPGGALHFLEHGLSPEAGVAAWQHRVEPLRRGLAGGCRLTRDPATLIAQAGFLVERTAQGLVRGPTLTSWLTCGWAVVRPA